MGNHPLDPRARGEAYHRFIERLAREGKLDLDPFRLATEASEEVRRLGAGVHDKVQYRQALRRGMLRSANCYCTQCAPADNVRLLGTEVAVRGARFDLVWEDLGVASGSMN